ncbi:ROK family transcriptional regulator [Paenibacillus tyrfis]|uniref:ROK family protein n=1 Tax=Paenibacillus tyrfis TaxID=1501230 RepID=A0A081NVE6_9BACL|nr:ROK family transcriptional regulator [Paenibacillus tyrfis]KEQ22419.1 ROK family protein [Paenibacillus tyrfis]
MSKIGNQQTMREINKSLLLNLLYQYSPISRVDLSRKSKLSPSTVSILIDEAIREGLVYESGTSGSGSGVGRKMTLLSIREDNGYVLGIDLSNSPSRCVLLNLKGKVIASQKLKHLTGEDMIRDELIGMIRFFLDNHGIGLESIKWMGVSIPGRISADQELISSTFLLVENMPLKSILFNAFQIPIHMVNDLDAAGFAERFSGAAKGHETIVYVLIDYGIGAGLVLNNQIFRGSTGRAGMIRELSEFGTDRIAGRLKAAYPETFKAGVPEETLQTFISLGLDGIEPFAGEMDAALHKIAKCCAFILHLINPEQLILSGWVTENKAFFERLISLMHGYEGRTTPIAASEWKDYGAAIGAATLGLHQMFKVMTIE